ncbi:MAG: ABC transporter substrate-binding protein [Xanthobacteraceae bacterium]
MTERRVRGIAASFFRPARLAYSIGVISIASIASASAQAPVKIGIPVFLSGPGAGSVGEPSRNAAVLVIDALNAGAVPAPYNSVGFNGAKIEPKIIDESGNTAAVVTEFRNLVQRDNVDVVLGYFSSANCLAVAPIADELKTLAVFYGCGSSGLFENAQFKYAFRPTPHTTSDNVAAALYLTKKYPTLKSYSGINQNYSWGQENWRDFALAMKVALPNAAVDKNLMTKLFAGDFGPEISALLSSGSTVVQSSFWGGDLESFVLQSVARGLPQRSPLVLTVGEQMLFRQAKNVPDGTIIGARGAHGVLALDNPLSSWFRDAYQKKFNAEPNFPAFQMFQTLLGLKAAWEKAAGDRKDARPSVDELAKAFSYLEFATGSGPIRMAIGGGHQGVQDLVMGVYQLDKASGKPRVVNLETFPAMCVNPPDGMTAREWLEKGMPGAKC